jgi:hypothetical protein
MLQLTDKKRTPRSGDCEASRNDGEEEGKEGKKEDEKSIIFHTDVQNSIFSLLHILLFC